MCLGHQGLIIAHGGTVSNLTPAHGVLEAILHDDSRLFTVVPLRTRVVRHHSLAAQRTPDVLVVTARTPLGVVMAVAHRELPHFGVQFHPESVLTDDGARMIENFLRIAGVSRHAPTVETSVSRLHSSRQATTSAHSWSSSWIEPAIVAATLLRGRRRAFWLDSAEH